MNNEQKLSGIHAEALRRFNTIHSAVADERIQCLEDRRFCSIAGAQWEGALSEMYENKPKFEFNKVHLAVVRIISEHRNNAVSVNFVSKDGANNDKLADACCGLYRADEQDSSASEAYYNAMTEAVSGGFGAWRLRACYEDDEDEENEHQRIRIEPIIDADSSVFFDICAKRQDKADAEHCFVISQISKEEYKEEYGEDPSTWPKTTDLSGFDWATSDSVFIAEYYVVEDKKEGLRTFRAIDGTETRYKEADFERDESLEEMLKAIGSVEIRKRTVKNKRVRKYILSGSRVLEDCGYIAGKCIPIVPVYGKRWFVDGIERCSGHVRYAKDAQTLLNMQMSRLAEISAYSAIEKPILAPEQIAGHEYEWKVDNVKNMPFLLIEPVTNVDGSKTYSAPLGYTKPPSIPQATAALIQIAEQGIQDILGNPQAGEQIVSNVSGKAVEMIQQRMDAQTYIYTSNFSLAMQRCGEIWLSMARDVYIEDSRKMKTVSESGGRASITLMQPEIDAETGGVVFGNDLGRAKFDVAVDVGPSSGSRRAATVRALTNVIQITQDPETRGVLTAMVMQNLEGEGIEEVRDYFRRVLVKNGAVKPSEKEAEEMAAEAQAMAQQQDPNSIYLQAAAEEAQAKAAQARASTVKTVADAELARAKTAETLAGIDLEHQRHVVDTVGKINAGFNTASAQPS